MARCQRSLIPYRFTQGSGLSRDVTIPVDTVSFTLRVADSSGTPIAFTVAKASEPAAAFHFVAGEAYTESSLKLAQDLELIIASASATDLIELLTWTD